MSTVNRVRIGQNHKSAEVLNQYADSIVALSGLNVGETFPGFATTPALAAEATARGAGDAALLPGTIPVVASTAVRDATYPTPTTNQRVLNLGTGDIERYTGSLWTPEFQKGQKRPRKTFDKLATALGGTNARVSTCSFGDSIAEFKAKFLFPAIERAMPGSKGLIGVNYPAPVTTPTYIGQACDLGATVNYTLLSSQWAYFPTGQVSQITSGGSAAWIANGVAPTFTKLTLYYITEPGAGTLTVTVGGVLKTTINTGVGTGIALGIYPLAQAQGQATVVVACTSGTVKLIEVHVLDETYSGVDNHRVSLAGVALSDMMSSATGRANLQAYLADAAIDLLTFEMKEASIEPDSSTYLSRLVQLGDILDAAIPTADKVMIGSTPLAVGDADQVIQNTTLKEFSVGRGYIYWDGYTPVKDYATLTALGWNGDGIHVDAKASLYLASLLWRDLGFDDVLAGLTTRAVNDRSVPSRLASGSSFGRVVGQLLQAVTDVFGLDWTIQFPRLLQIKDDAANLIAQFTTSAVYQNVLPAAFRWGGAGLAATTGPGVSQDSSTGQTILVFDDSSRTPSLMPLKAGAARFGPYTVAQLPGIANSIPGAIAYTTDGAQGGTGSVMIARGVNTSSDWVPLDIGMGSVPGIGVVGDVSATQTNASSKTLLFNAPLTANRTFAANATTQKPYTRIRVVRTAAATGAFAIDVAGLKSLATAGTWCEIEWSTSLAAFVLVAAGSL